MGDPHHHGEDEPITAHLHEFLASTAKNRDQEKYVPVLDVIWWKQFTLCREQLYTYLFG
jgi:hypothetical protein